MYPHQTLNIFNNPNLNVSLKAIFVAVFHIDILLGSFSSKFVPLEQYFSMGRSCRQTLLALYNSNMLSHNCQDAFVATVSGGTP